MRFASETGSYRFPKKEWSRKALICGFVAWLVVSLGLIALGAYDIYENHLFATDGALIQGLVDRKFKTPSGRGTVTYLVYSYEVAGVRYASPSTPVTRGVWLESRTGEPITIRCLAHDPATSEIEDEKSSDATFRWMPMVVGILVLGCGLFHFTTHNGQSMLRRMRSSWNSAPGRRRS